MGIEIIKELILFGVIVFFVILFSRLFFYDMVQREVRQTSRCIRERSEFARAGTFSVLAKNALNLPLYKVQYDLKNKRSSVECACKSGEVVNAFTNIPYYDFNSKKSATIPEKLCECESNLQANANSSVYYSGTPGVIRFMNDQTDVKFFNRSV